MSNKSGPQPADQPEDAGQPSQSAQSNPPAQPEQPSGPSGRLTATSIVVGSSLLVGAVMMITDYLGWVDLPQPATLLVTVVLILAGGIVYEAHNRRRPKGLLIAAAILAILAIPATGHETSDGEHDHEWGDHGWSHHSSDESSAIGLTNATVEGALS